MVYRCVKLLHIKVDELLKENYTDAQIINQLTKEGIDTHYAEIIIGNVRDDQEDKKSFRNSMIMGSFYIFAGGLINILSYIIASNANSFFFYAFWGIVVLGVVTIIRGFILYKR
jgi:hypothetical protein